MKKTLYLLFLLGFPVFSQTIDYNRIIPAENSKKLDMSEKLVQVAWKNLPTNQILQQRAAIANADVKKTKFAWLDYVTVSGNLNEFNINPQKNADGSTVPNFFPRYNIGASVRLGSIVSIPAERRKAESEARIAEQNLNQAKIALRAEVLRAYANYLTNKELLALQNQVSEDALGNFTLAEQKFKDGKITFNELNAVTAAYNAEKNRQLQAENKLTLSKIDLEELIGVKLEEVK
jgi:outer membrane protein TolC